MAVKTYQDSKDKYLKEKVDTFVLRVPKGKKDEIAQYAAGLGMSLNGYITSLIFADMGTESDMATKAPAPKTTKAKKATKPAAPKKAAAPKAEKAPAPKMEKEPAPEKKEPKVIIIPADPQEEIVIPQTTEEAPQEETKRKRNMPSFLL